MFLSKFEKTSSRPSDLGAVIIEQLLWYLVLGLGLPYFLIHILLAVV